MIASMKPSAPPIYAIVDHRRDGERRIVAEYIDPRTAAAAAELLRAAGADVQIELVSAVVDVDGEKILGGPR